MQSFPLLSVLVFFPILISLVLVFLTNPKTIRWIAISTCVFELAIGVVLYLNFDTQVANYQFVEKFDWISLSLGKTSQLSIDYILAIDGISLPLILMSILVFLVATFASWSIKSNIKGYYALLMLLLGTVLGCFMALDLFLFYLFFEFMLLPMYFLIGIWGGEGREKAALKFLLYTLFGSVLILISIIGLYLSGTDPVASVPEAMRVFTFRIDFLSDNLNIIPDSVLSLSSSYKFFGLGLRNWAFIFLMIGFLIKLPAVPFHTWLPEAHVEAPTPVSVILAAVLLKIGAYGMFRIAYPIFPEMATLYATPIAIVGMISILYAAYCALAMTDLKKMIAYSSISHMGFVLLGLASGTTEGVSGALYQLVSHGFISAALFLIVGAIYERTHDRNIINHKGLANRMPKLTAVVVISFFASLGLPGFSGFVAEALVFMGSFKTLHFATWIAIASTLGLILGAAYYLWALQRMYFGKYYIKPGLITNPIEDISTKEILAFIPLLFFVLLLGIMPSLLTDIFNSSIARFLENF